MIKSSFANTILIIVQISTSLFFHIWSVYKLSILLYFIFLRSKKCISVFLISFLINWLISALIFMPYEAYVLALWRPKEEPVLYSAHLVYWSAFLWMAHSLAPPIALLFITIERIFVILHPLQYQKRHGTMLFTLYVLISVGFSLLLCISLYPLQPLPAYSECFTFGCLEGFRNRLYVYSKAIVGLSNYTCGGFFLCLLYRYQSRTHIREARLSNLNNVMVIVAIFIEFFINFVPYTVPFILYYIFGYNVLSVMGLFTSTFASIEALAYSIIFSRTIIKSSKISSGTPSTNKRMDKSFTSHNVEINRF